MAVKKICIVLYLPQKFHIKENECTGMYMTSRIITEKNTDF